MSGGKGGGAKTKTITPELPAELKGLLPGLASGINTELKRTTFAAPKQSSQTIAGLRDIGRAGSFGGLADSSLAGVSPEALGAIKAFAGGDYATPEAVQSRVEAASAPAIRNLQRSILPSIASEFGASGRSGSGAEQAAITDVADATSRSVAEAAAGALSDAENRRLQAAGFLPELADVGLRTDQNKLAAGQARFAAGSALDADRLARKDRPLNRITQIASTLPGFINNPQVIQKSGKSGKGGALGSLAGAGLGGFLGGGAGAGLGAQLGGQVGGYF